jgi:hypothetical protein
MRKFLVLSALLTAACSGGGDDGGAAASPDAVAEQAAPDTRIFCALDGKEDFSRSCTVEESAAEGKLVLIVRHPDGAFRRFEVVTDGRGLVSADGADEAGVAPNGDLLDVRVGEDRYRFPYTPKKAAPAAAATGDAAAR